MNNLLQVSNIIGIIGIIATIILGYLGVKYTLKFRNKVQLTFYWEEAISLFDSIVKEWKLFDIKYNNKPINPSLVLLKCCIVNSGTSDIDKNIVHQPLKMILPEYLNTIQGQTGNFSEGLVIKPKIDN